MDRAQRRQRRLDQKIWRGERPGRGRGRGRGRPRLQVSEASNCESAARPGSMGAPHNISEEETSEDVSGYDGGIDLSSKDLEAELHLSSARGMKWQKIAAERSEKNKELQTEIQCLNLKIKEITEAKAARHGQVESKLRAENQHVKEKNNELIKTINDLLKHYTSEADNLKRVLQAHVDGSPKTFYRGTDESGYLGKHGHENKADVTIDIGGQSSEDVVCGNHGLPREVEQSPSGGNLRPSKDLLEEAQEVLFTAAERKSALALVDQEFLMWLNSRTRRPTAKEMSFHKSQLMESSWSPGKEEAFYWTGIPGSVLLEKFHAETQMEMPSCEILTTLLRSVLRVTGSKRTNDMLWCLVWADCMNADQLPGYARLPPKRPRSKDM